MALNAFDYLTPADVINAGLTPDRDNYLDVYDFTTRHLPQFKGDAIEKYNNTIVGFIDKYAAKEVLRSNKFIWSELEHKAVSYDDAIVTFLNGNITLTRANGALLAYRYSEKVVVNSGILQGIFIVTSLSGTTSISLGTYDAASIAIQTAAVNLTGVYTYSLGIEVKMGSSGADFTTGVKRQYRIFDNRPAITREIYSENGSAPPVVGWVTINGQPKWFLEEIDDTRERFFEAIEKKGMEGTVPDPASTAATANGLQGTDGLFAQIQEHGASWGGLISTQSDIDSLVKHLNKVDGSGDNMLFCHHDQEVAFDTLGQSFNANYGTATIPFIGNYDNSTDAKVLNLSYYGFQRGGYKFYKQGWKYLKDNAFRGNDLVPAAKRILALMIPLGTTPTSDGDQNLAFNERKIQRNFLTQFSTEGRDYDSWTEGGAWVAPRTNGDDSFKVHFLNEGMLVGFAREKFLLVKGA